MYSLRILRIVPSTDLWGIYGSWEAESDNDYNMTAKEVKRNIAQSSIPPRLCKKEGIIVLQKSA